MKKKPGSLLKYRLAQAEESIKDAQILFNGGGSPRGIIDASYYAMFYSALALFSQKENGDPLPDSSHSRVLEIFEREYIKAGVFPREMSQLYHHCFDLKEECVYLEFSPADNEKALEIMNGARFFLNEIKTHLKTRVKQDQILNFLEVIREKFS